MQRLRSGLVVLSLLAAGASLSACTAGGSAATVGDSAITTASLNADLSALSGTVSGRCLLALQLPQLLGYSGIGAGGQGTYSVAFAGSVLGNRIGDLVAARFAASHGVVVTPALRAEAASNYASILDGEITANVQSAGTSSPCLNGAGGALTGQTLIDGLPSSFRTAQIEAQAVDDALLAHGADLSPAAIQAYYDANVDQFTVDCLSVIATSTQANADTAVNSLRNGVPFADLARTYSLDKTTAAQGGSLGCSFTEDRVKSALQLTTVTPGVPITPIQTSTGIWAVYQVTSRTVEPLSAVTGLVRSELVRSTPNVERVSRLLGASARYQTITVDPRYGTWQGIKVKPPPSPPIDALTPFLASTPSGSTAHRGA